MKRLVVLASGTGTNFENIVQACRAGRIAAEVVGLICNTPKALALERAGRLGVPAQVVAPEDGQNLAAVRGWQADYVILAGYLKKIGPAMIAAYPHRMLNIHPSLLPKYGGHGMYGRRVSQAVLDAGDLESGVTVHTIDEEWDRGRILAQRRIALAGDETLESLLAKIGAVEKDLYVEVLRQLCK